jgi:hypothetical protein
MLGLFFVVVCLPYIAYETNMKKRAEAQAALEREELVTKIYRTKWNNE